MSPSRHHHQRQARRRLARRNMRPVTSSSWLATPPPDAEIEITGVAEAMVFAIDLVHLFGDHFAASALVLVDENDQVSGVMFDTPIDLENTCRRLMGPEFGVECAAAMLVVRRAEIQYRDPSPADLAAYDAGRAMCERAGVRWLDLVFANDELAQSVGIVCDPTRAWLPPSAA